MVPAMDVDMAIVEQIDWLGHDSFRIDAGGLIVYIDPWKLGSDSPKADIILITHDHYDHCSPEDVAMIQKDDTEIVCCPDSEGKLSGMIHTVAPGDKITVKGIPIEAVRAYNVDKKFHPKRNNWVGYIITVDGVRIYHAGDTDFIPEMKEINADIALLPVSGTYVMTAREAVEAAKVIGAKIYIPMHYGTIVGSDADAEYFRKNAPGKVLVLPKESE